VNETMDVLLDEAMASCAAKLASGAFFFGGSTMSASRGGGGCIRWSEVLLLSDLCHDSVLR